MSTDSFEMKSQPDSVPTTTVYSINSHKMAPAVLVGTPQAHLESVKSTNQTTKPFKRLATLPHFLRYRSLLVLCFF